MLLFTLCLEPNSTYISLRIENVYSDLYQNLREILILGFMLWKVENIIN